MDFETAAKVLTYDEEGGQVIGEFWVENESYDVLLSKESYLEGVVVQIEDLDSFQGSIVNRHHVINEAKNARSVSGTEYQARLPEDNNELEAYVLKALNDSGIQHTLNL